jgi:hypothetical protein
MSEPLAVSGTMPFRILLDEAIRLSRRHALTILPTIALPSAVMAAVLGGLQMGMLGSAGNPEADPIGVLASSCSVLLLSLIFLFFLAISFAAMQVAALDATAGRPVDMGRAWKTAVRPGLLGTILLQGIAVFAALMACFVPVLYVFPLLSLSLAAAAEEGLYGPRALSRSAELTQHNPQRRFLSTPMVKVLVIWVIGTALSWVVSLLVNLPMNFLFGWDAFRKIYSGEEPDYTAWVWPQVATNFVSGLFATVVYLFLAFGLALLFFDTRNRKEGTDLAAAVNAMTTPPPPPAPPSWDAPR